MLVLNLPAFENQKMHSLYASAFPSHSSSIVNKMLNKKMDLTKFLTNIKKNEKPSHFLLQIFIIIFKII